MRASSRTPPRIVPPATTRPTRSAHGPGSKRPANCSASPPSERRSPVATEREDAEARIVEFDFSTMAWDTLDTLAEKLGLPQTRDGWADQALYLKAWEGLSDEVDAHLNAIPPCEEATR